MKSVQIIVSTYNGHQYLPTQLDSLLAQDVESLGIARLNILVRDDGSKDDTHQILEEYKKNYPGKVEWYTGPNLRSAKSFFDLMTRSTNFDYVCLCDQDDYWLPNKVSSAIQFLEHTENQDEPKLYCCRVTPVDANLEPLPNNIPFPPVNSTFGFRNALVQCVATGCGCVLNNQLVNLICKQLPEFTIMHDWWAYLCATAFGHFYFDENSYIKYRQHAGNVIGMKTSAISRFIMRAKRYPKNRGQMYQQIVNFVSIFEKDYPNSVALSQAKQLVDAKHNLFKRIKFLAKVKPYRQEKRDNLIMTIIILLGNY